MAEEKKIVYTVEVKADDNGLQKIDEAAKGADSSIKSLGSAIDKLGKETNDYKRYNEATEGSIDKLTAKSILLKKEINGINQSTEEGKLKAAELQKKYELNEKAIAGMTGATKKGGKELGGLSKNTQGASGMLSMFGGTLGKIPMIIKNVTTGFKAFSAALLSNPIGLIMVAIAALIAMIVGVLRKFQPFLDFISDKISYVTGLINGFVSALKSIFTGSSKGFKETAKNIADVAKATEELNKATREYGRQQKLNDATTAESMVTMNKLKAAYKDESNSVEERKKSFEEYYKMKKSQAEDDYNAFNKQHEAQMKLYNLQYEAELEAHGLKLDNATDVKAAMDEGILTEEEYNTVMDSIIKNEELRGKVEEVNTQKAEEQNTLRNQMLTQQLNLIKAQTAYWSATHQSILEGKKRFSKKMLDEEAARLDEENKMNKEALLEKYKQDIEAHKNNEEKKLELKLKYDTDVINLDKKTNDEKKKNNETYYQNLLKTAGEALNLWKQQNIDNLKDVTIETDEELKERIKLHTEQNKKQEALIKQTAATEKWSATRLKTELLKNQQELADTTLKLTENLEKNKKTIRDQEKKEEEAKNKEILDANKELIKQFEKIEADLLKNKQYTEDEQLKIVDDNLKSQQQILEDNLSAGLITEEKYHKLSQDLLNASETEKKRIKDEFELKEKEKDDNKILAEQEKMLNDINAITEFNQILTDLNSAMLDNQLTDIQNKYNQQDKLAEDAYKAEVKRIKNTIKDEKLQAEALAKLDEDYGKAKTDRDKIRAEEEYQIKKKAFDRQKALNIAQVIMDTARAIMGIWSGVKDPYVGANLATIQSIMVAALGAVQLSTIAKTQFQGAGGGKLFGDLHAQASGGMRLTPNIMAEGGEFLVNRASTERYEPLLNAINSAGNSNGDTNNVSQIIDYERLGQAVRSNIKTYVVSSEMTDQQAEDTRIVDLSQF